MLTKFVDIDWLFFCEIFICEIWGKFTSFMFWRFEISLISLGKFQNFKKVNSVNLSQISLLKTYDCYYKPRSHIRKSPLLIINYQPVIMKVSTVYDKVLVCYHEYKSHLLAEMAFHNLVKDVWWNFFAKIINNLTGFQIPLLKHTCIFLKPESVVFLLSFITVLSIACDKYIRNGLPKL